MQFASAFIQWLFVDISNIHPPQKMRIKNKIGKRSQRLPLLNKVASKQTCEAFLQIPIWLFLSLGVIRWLL